MTTSKRAKKPRVKRVLLPSVMAPDAKVTISVEKPGEEWQPTNLATSTVLRLTSEGGVTVSGVIDYNPADHPVRRR